MRLIYPPNGTAVDDLGSLADAYAYPNLGAGSGWVRVNMVTSLDGAVQGPDGRSATVSSPPDRTVLALLRGLADVVLVGAGTARAERYGPAEAHAEFAESRRRHGQRPTPPIAVVSRHLDVDPSAPLFTAATEPTIVLTVEASPASQRNALAKVADVVVAGEQSVDIEAAIAALVTRGLPRILCEGGPHLLASIIAAGQLDELCHTMTPKIVGGRSARMVETPQQLSSEWTLGHVIEDGGTLLTRWVAISHNGRHGPTRHAAGVADAGQAGQADS